MTSITACSVARPRRSWRWRDADPLRSTRPRAPWTSPKMDPVGGPAGKSARGRPARRRTCPCEQALLRSPASNRSLMRTAVIRAHPGVLRDESRRALRRLEGSRPSSIAGFQPTCAVRSSRRMRSDDAAERLATFRRHERRRPRPDWEKRSGSRDATGYWHGYANIAHRDPRSRRVKTRTGRCGRDAVRSRRAHVAAMDRAVADWPPTRTRRHARMPASGCSPRATSTGRRAPGGGRRGDRGARGVWKANRGSTAVIMTPGRGG